VEVSLTEGLEGLEAPLKLKRKEGLESCNLAIPVYIEGSAAFVLPLLLQELPTQAIK
jgi:hypothetical protein